MDGSLGGARATISLDAAQAMAALRQFGSAADQTMRGVGASGTQASSGIDRLSAGLSSPGIQAAGGALTAVGAAVGLLGGFAINSAMQFDQGMANVRAATGATGAEFDSLRNLALQIGKDTSFSANEATLAIEELAKAGVSTTDILGGAAEATTALAAAGGVDLPTAATVMSAALNQYGLAAGDASGYTDQFGKSVNNASHVADVIAAAASTSATGVTEMGSSLSYVGTSAAALGVPLEDTATALGLMANQGIVGSSAGTSLNQVLLSLANPTAKAAGVMNDLGLSFTDMNGNMLPLPDIIGSVATATEGMGTAQRAATLETLFGVEGGRAMNALLPSVSASVQGTTDSWNGMHGAVTQVGAAQEQAQARLDSTKGRLEAMKGSLETVGIVIGSKVLPFFDLLIIGATNVLNAFLNLPSGIQTVIAAVVGVAGAFAGIAGAAILIGPKLIEMARGFQVVSVAMRAMIVGNPILLAIAAAIGLVVLAIAAYKTNFLGFGDAVRAVGSTVKSAFSGIVDGVAAFVESFKSYFDFFSSGKMLKPIHDLAGGITYAMVKVAEPMQLVESLFHALAQAIRLVTIQNGGPKFLIGLAAWLDRIAPKVQAVVDAFQLFRERGINPVSSALLAIGSVFTSLSSAMANFSVAFTFVILAAQALGRALGDLVHGDLAGFQHEIAFAASYALDAVSSMLAGISDLFGVLADKFTGLAGIFRPLQSLFGDLSQAFLDLGRAVNALIQGDFGRARDFFFAFADDMKSAFFDAIDVVTGIFSTLGGIIVSAFDAIPWAAIGSTLLSAIQAVTSAAFSALQAGADWVLDVAAPTLGGWVLNAAGWVGDHLGAIVDGVTGVAKDFGNWALNILGPGVITTVWAGVSAIIDWIEGLLGIGGVAASPDGIPTGGGDTTVTWGDWAISVLEPLGGILAAGWNFLTLVGSKIGEWAVAAAGYVIHWAGWSAAIGVASDILAAGWDFLTLVGSKIGQWALAAVGYVIHWGGWSVAVGSAMDIIQAGWDFLTMVGGKIGQWAIAAAGYVLHWSGWSVSVGTAMDVLQAGWDFLTLVGSKIGQWALAAVGYVVHWAGWSAAIGVASDILAAGWDFLTLVGSKIAGWAVAAAGYVIHWAGWSVVVGWATDIAQAGWDFLANVGSFIANLALSAAGYVAHWAGWSVAVGWAMDVAQSGWDFLTMIAGKLAGWAIAAAGYVVHWAGWSAMVGVATSVVQAGWDFLTLVGSKIGEWAVAAGQFTLHWAGWALDILQSETVTNAIGDVATWLQPYVDGFIGGTVLDGLNWALSIGEPANGISVDFNWTELAAAAFTGTITLDPNISMDIKSVGAKVGSWINGALTDPDTIKWIGIGVAAMVALAFVGPGAVLTIALAAAAPLVAQAVVSFFEGVFGALDFGGIFDTIMNEITGGLANVLDGIAAALDAAPDWAVPDGLVTDIRGWGDDLRALGEENGLAFNDALRQAIENGTLPGGGDPALVNGSMGKPIPETPGAPTLPGGAQGPVNPATPTLPGGLQGPVQTTGKFSGSIFAQIIQQANEAKRQFGDVMLGIGTDSLTAKTAVVGALTGMGLEGLPPVSALATSAAATLLAFQGQAIGSALAAQVGVVGSFVGMQTGSVAEVVGLQAQAGVAFAAMQADGAGKAGLLNAAVKVQFADLTSRATETGTSIGKAIAHRLDGPDVSSVTAAFANVTTAATTTGASAAKSLNKRLEAPDITGVTGAFDRIAASAQAAGKAAAAAFSSLNDAAPAKSAGDLPAGKGAPAPSPKQQAPSLGGVPDTGAATSALAAAQAAITAAAVAIQRVVSTMKIGVVADVTDMVNTTIALAGAWQAGLVAIAAPIDAAVRMAVSTMKMGVVADITDTVTTTLALFGAWAIGIPAIAMAVDLGVRLPISTMKIGVVTDVTDLVTSTIALFGAWAVAVPAIALAIDLGVRTPISTMKIGVVTDVTDLVSSTIALMGAWAAALPAIAIGVDLGVRASISTMKIGAVADVTDLVSSSIAQFGAMSAGLVAIASNVSAGVRSAISSMKIGAVSDVRDLVSSAIAQFGAMSSGLTGIASNIRGSVTGAMAGMAGGATGAVAGMVGSVIGAMSSMAGQSVGIVSGMAGQIIGIMSGLAGQAGGAGQGIGASFGQGIVAGMSAYVNEAAAMAARIVSAAIGAARATQQSSSPAKVTTKEGGFWGQGYVNGIAAFIKPAAWTAAAVVGAAVDAMNSTAPAFGFGGFGSGAPASPLAVSPLGSRADANGSSGMTTINHYHTTQTVERIEVNGAGDPQAVGRAVVESLGAAWADHNGLGRGD